MAKLVLLDGAVGTALSAAGVDASGPLFSAAALLDDGGRAALRQIHLEQARAGAEVLTAATFRTSRRTLARAGLSARFPALARAAVALARAAAEAAGREQGRALRVAGSLAPLEDCYQPGLAPAPAEARAEHAEHAQALAEAGCDLLLVETVCSAPEGLAAVEAAVATGLPVWVSAMATPRSQLLDGSRLDDFFRAAALRGAAAALLNCTPCDGIDRALDDAAASGLPFGAYAHMGQVDPACGWSSGPVFAPAEYRRRAERWRARGASILGGCCGTGAAHVAALATLA